MKFLARFRSRLRAILHRSRTESEMDAELRSHIEAYAEDLIRTGLPRVEALRRARLEFGGLERVKEECRESRGVSFIESLLQDLRFGLRMLRKSPGFTVVAVLTLALGIGANTAIFSAVNAIWIEPFLNARASRMVTVDLLSIPEIHAIQKQSTAFERTAIYQGYGGLIVGGGIPVEAMNTAVSDDFFPMLGVKPLLGRFILPEDVQPGRDLVAVLSYGLWRDDFGGDSHIVGRSITVDQKPYTVIGVMPKEFNLGVNWGGGNPGVWTPSAFPLSDPVSRGRFSSFVARLKPGVTVGQVESQLDAIYARLEAEHPRQYPKTRERYGRYGWLVTAGIHGRTNSFVHLALSLLFAAVGFVLLMACVNVTSLLVARSWTRQQELAIRKALGATRSRIVRQLFSESLLLAVAGGAMGLFFSVWGIRLIRVIAPPYTPRLNYIRLDAHVLWFTLVASLLAAILIGPAPALHATARRVGATLKGGLGGSFAETNMRQSHGFRCLLVVLEVALAVIVVAGGALMARSFYLLMHVDTGVRADHVIAMSVWLSDSTCHDSSLQSNKLDQSQASARGKSPRKQKTQNQPSQDKYGPGGCYALATANVLDGIQSLPGVQQVAISDSGPFQGGYMTSAFHYPGENPGTGLFIDGQQGNQLTSGNLLGRSATPDLFDALGIRVLKGRTFQQTDIAIPPRVAIVSEGFAKEYIRGNPLGKQFSVNADAHGRHEWMTIVGEVNDVRDRSVNEPFSGLVYYTPYPLGDKRWRILARTTVDPTTIVPAMERVVRSVDPEAPITHIETVDQIIAQSAAQPKFQTVLLGSFAILGLLLAVIGTYGVASYSAVQRTHEIGVRMAMGANSSDILRMVLGEGLLLAVIGIAIGVAGALALTRFLRSMLFEIKPTDPATFIGVAILLALVALAACYIPARRAMNVDPIIALRYE
jgi:putative ABC transport system permease protein